MSKDKSKFLELFNQTQPNSSSSLLSKLKEAASTSDETALINLFANADLPSANDLDECFLYLLDHFSSSTPRKDKLIGTIKISSEQNSLAFIPLYSLFVAKCIEDKDFTRASVTFNMLILYRFDIFSFAFESFFSTFATANFSFSFSDIMPQIFNFSPKLVFPKLNWTKTEECSGPTADTFLSYFKLLAMSDNHLQIPEDFFKLPDSFKTKEIQLVVLEYLVSKEKFALAELFLNKANIKIFDITFLSLSLETFNGLKRADKSWSVFDTFLNLHSLADSRSLVAMAKSLSLDFSREKVNRLVSLIDSHSSKIVLETVLFNIVIDNLGKLKDIPTMERLFNQLLDTNCKVNPDTVTFNIMIKGYCKVEFFSKAYSIFELASQRSCVNDVTYNSVIDVAVRDKQIDFVWQLIADMQNHNIKPDSYTYSTIIKGLKQQSSSSHFNTTMSLFKEVKKISEPDEILYNCVMDACLRFKKLDEMFEVYEELKSKNVEESSVTYGILMKAYAQMNDFDKVFSLFEEMEVKGIPYSQVTFGCIINLCIKNNDYTKAMSYFDQLEERNIPMNTVLYTTLIKIYSKMRKVDQVMEVFDKMNASREDKPNNITFNSVIDCLVKEGRMEQAERVFELLMKDKSCKPDVITFSTLMKGYTRKGQIEKAKKHVIKMSKHHVKPDDILLNSFLDGCEKNELYGEALDIFELFKNLGVRPTFMSYSLMLKLLGKINDFSSSERIFKEAVDRGNKNSVVIFTCFIKTCFFSKQPKKAHSAFKLFLSNEGRTDKMLYSTMVNGMLRNRENEIAVDMLIEAGKQGMVDNVGLCSRVASVAGKRTKEVLAVMDKLKKKKKVNHSTSIEYLLGNYNGKNVRKGTKRLGLNLNKEESYYK